MQNWVLRVRALTTRMLDILRDRSQVERRCLEDIAELKAIDDNLTLLDRKVWKVATDAQAGDTDPTTILPFPPRLPKPNELGSVP